MSLRRSLIVAFAVLLTVIGSLGALFAYTSAKREAWDIMDLQQRQISRFVGDGNLLVNADKTLFKYNSDEDYIIQLRARQGNEIKQSSNNLVFPKALPDGFSEYVDGQGTWRIFSRTSENWVINVAQKTSERNELAADAAVSSAMPFLFAIPLSWLVVYVLVGTILGRLNEIVLSVEQRSLHDTNPLPLSGVPTEIQPLIHAVNAAFERIKLSVDQQQQFLSDAAHELRTPLAALSLQIGNLKSSSVNESSDSRLAPLEKGIKRASKVTSQLLHLARQDAQKVPKIIDVVELDKLLMSVIETLMPLAQEKEIDLGLTHIEPGNTKGNRQDLIAMLETIIENSLKYTPKGGIVDIDLRCYDKTAVLTIKDTGPGIPENLLNRVFDRFYRASDQDELGTGLGLSIAKSIADQHDIQIHLANRTDRTGLTADLRFNVC